QIAQPGRIVVHSVNRSQVVDRGNGYRVHDLRRQVHAWRGSAAQDYAVQPLHDVERGAEDGFVFTVQQRARDLGVDPAQTAEHAVFAPHVVRRLDVGAKGRASQHQFAIAQPQQVGKVGEAAGELLDHQRAAGAGQLGHEIVFQRCEIQFFATPYGRRLVESAHIVLGSVGGNRGRNVRQS